MRLAGEKDPEGTPRAACGTSVRANTRLVGMASAVNPECDQDRERPVLLDERSTLMSYIAFAVGKLTILDPLFDKTTSAAVISCLESKIHTEIALLEEVEKDNVTGLVTGGRMKPV